MRYRTFFTVRTRVQYLARILDCLRVSPTFQTFALLDTHLHGERYTALLQFTNPQSQHQLERLISDCIGNVAEVF